MNSHELHEWRVLSLIETGGLISQRSVARELGIALGLTNLLLRKMVRQGWVRLVCVRPNRIRYFVTPAGMAEKTRMSQMYFIRNVHFYRETRDRIRGTFEAISQAWDADRTPGAAEKRIAFYGAGEVAEIGFVCLQESDLRLVAVVDRERKGAFFGLPVQRPDVVRARQVNGIPFDRLIVMTFDTSDAFRAELKACRVDPDSVVWV